MSCPFLWFKRPGITTNLSDGLASAGSNDESGPLTSSDHKLTCLFHHLELKKKRAFRKFSYRGIDLDQYVHITQFPKLSDSLHSLPPSTANITWLDADSTK